VTQGRKPAGDTSPDSLYLHCLTTYRAMLASATAKVVFDGAAGEAGEEKTIIVWEGMLTQFITGELHLSVPYYTKITQALKRMGCVQQLKRGGGTAPSIWELITEPTEELYKNKLAPKKKGVGKDYQFQQQLDDMNRRISIMERAFAKLIDEEK
jgi:hypothetical protein